MQWSIRWDSLDITSPSNVVIYFVGNIITTSKQKETYRYEKGPSVIRKL